MKKIILLSTIVFLLTVNIINSAVLKLDFFKYGFATEKTIETTTLLKSNSKANIQPPKKNTTSKKNTSPKIDSKTNEITCKVFAANNNTWGYDIYLAGNKVVHQPFKPGISGNEGFKDSTKAATVAHLVINKIRNGIMPPTISIQEMENVGVL